MNIGDYVRTDDGIKKVLKYTYNEKYENGHCVWFNNKDHGILFTDEEINKMKPSSNIIDLIEVGDILEIKDMLGNISKVEVDENFELLTGTIVAITTHEQYEANKYKIGE